MGSRLVYCGTERTSRHSDQLMADANSAPGIIDNVCEAYESGPVVVVQKKNFGAFYIVISEKYVLILIVKGSANTNSMQHSVLVNYGGHQALW